MRDDRICEPKKAAPLRQPFYLSQINSIHSKNLTNPRLNDFSWASNHSKHPSSDNSFFTQIPFRIQSCHTAATCCSNSLPVNLILHITGSKYTLYISPGGAGDSLDITCFVHIKNAFEYITVGV